MKRQTALFAALVSVGLVIATVFKPAPKLIYNGSKSAPLGLFWMVNGPINRGDYVAFHVPVRLKNWVVNHDILPPNTPLLKRVLGLKGDQVCRKNTLIFVDGGHVATAKLSDKAGRPMPSWQSCVTLTDDQFFLIGDHPAPSTVS